MALTLLMESGILGALSRMLEKHALLLVARLSGDERWTRLSRTSSEEPLLDADVKDEQILLSSGGRGRRLPLKGHIRWGISGLNSMSRRGLEDGGWGLVGFPQKGQARVNHFINYWKPGKKEKREFCGGLKPPFNFLFPLITVFTVFLYRIYFCVDFCNCFFWSCFLFSCFLCFFPSNPRIMWSQEMKPVHSFQLFKLYMRSQTHNKLARHRLFLQPRSWSWRLKESTKTAEQEERQNGDNSTPKLPNPNSFFAGEGLAPKWIKKGKMQDRGEAKTFGAQANRSDEQFAFSWQYKT
jgi:hypothetical protein